MNKLITLFCLALLFVLGFSQNKCATFWDDANFKGNSFKLCSDSNVPAGHNDKVSSISIPAGIAVRIYTDADFEGRTDRYIGPKRINLLQFPFNDSVSSVQIFQKGEF